jgi:hypothetical protein
MARGITLNRYAQSRQYVENRGEGFRLRVTATDGEGVPEEIFLHEATLINPYTGAYGEQFVCVCSAVDITLYPANVADVTQWPSFYRRAYFDIIVPSQDIADDTWTAVQAEVSVLIAALNKMEYLAESEAVRLGDDLTIEESESVSEPGSASVSESAGA